MEGECLDEHNTSGPKNDKNLQEEVGTGWETISISEDGILAKVDSDFRPNRTDDVWKEWKKKKMMAAAQQCQEMGKDLGVYKQYLDELFKSKIPWYQILLNYLTPLFDKTRKWLPPNRRHVYKRMYLPSLKKENQLKIVVAIDTSGSTSGDIVKRFVSEVFAILNSFGGYELRLIQCDYEIQEDKIFNIEIPFIPDNFNLLGGGGTDFTPVFDIIAKDSDLPELLLFLTDGYGSAPDTQPPYPVIWGIIEGGRCPVNWGSQLEIDLES